MTVWVKVRLTKALGSTRANQVFEDAMQRMKCSQLDGPQHLLEFAEILIAQGGLVMTVGCTFKVHATLRGASSTP